MVVDQALKLMNRKTMRSNFRLMCEPDWSAANSMTIVEFCFIEIFLTLPQISGLIRASRPDAKGRTRGRHDTWGGDAVAVIDQALRRDD
jgi:hypothetical protein